MVSKKVSARYVVVRQFKLKIILIANLAMRKQKL